MPANRYFNLPTLGRQLTVIAAAVIGYGLLVGLGDFYFPDLSDAAKKKLTQIGLVSLYLASLSEIQHIALLRSQEKLLNTSFAGEIARREAEIAEADRQSNIVSDLPKVFDYSGALSLVLTAIGTALCFIGAG
jgi:hypothetical protein